MYIFRDDEDGWQEASRLQGANAAELFGGDSDVQHNMQAAANISDPLEAGRHTIESNLRQKILVNRYGSAASHLIPTLENHEDLGYSMFSSSQPSTDNIYWPFRSCIDWLVAC